MSSTWYPPPSRPRPVEGGIKARSTRGAIAQTWWSERFIAVLEDIGRPDYAVPCKHLAATFYLLAESFDEDPFAILAWRGREREDLLANLAAARADGAAPAADHAEQVAQPLTDCLDRYYARQADINVPSPPATPSTALLDQLPDTGLSARGRPLTELLRPAYHALTHHHNSAGG